VPLDPFLPATELVRLLAEGEVSSRELLDAHLDRIDRLDGALGAVVTLDAERARAAADELDRRRAGGESAGRLHGLPMTLKDCWATEGLRTTAGAVDLADQVPAADAVVTARLRAAGAVIFGKTNLPEGVTGQETANELFGRTLNPWDPERTPGGSSGGAAAAVAAGLVPLEVGSDSGGSIRQPAHLCGVYGHFPTHGLVPLRGHLPSLPVGDVGADVDCMGAGPIARSAADLDLALGVLAGPDGNDAAGMRLHLPPATVAVPADLRVAVWPADPALPVARNVRDRLGAAADALADAGAAVVEDRPAVASDVLREVAFTLWVSSTAQGEDEQEHERLVAEAEAAGGGTVGDLTALRARGQAIRHRDWQLVDAERRRVERAWAEVFERADVVLCPVSPVAALRHDPDPSAVDSVDHRLARTIEVDGTEQPYLEQIMWNVVVGMARIPSTVAPVGLTPADLPVGVQVVGPRFADRTTIAVAGMVGDLCGGFRPPPAFA
jgi:amidase